MSDFDQWKPSLRLAAYLSGRDLEPAPAIASWARLEIHRAAVEVLSLPKEEREGWLSRIPSHIVPMVRQEANRVWAWRRAHRE